MVEGVIAESEDFEGAVGEIVRWRCKVRAWMSLMRCESGRSSAASRKMVRL